MRTISFLLLLALAGPVRAAEEPVPRPVLSADSVVAAVAARVMNQPPGLRPPREWARAVWEGLREEGWLWARVALSAGADTLVLDAGPRARILHLSRGGADSLQWARFTEASGIVEGALYRPGRWQADCSRGLARLGDGGYPFASLSVRRIEPRPQEGGVELDLLLLPGVQASVEKIRVEGATHTRPEILARLSGLREGQVWSERSLEMARQRLEARQIVQRVVEAEPLLSGADLSKVDVLLKVQQSQSSGRISAALGMTGGQDDRGSRVFGNVDLILLDLFGTARQLSLRYLDDGRSRRTLDISYLEPLVFHSPFDLRVAAGQRHQEGIFDTILGDLSLRLPWHGVNDVEAGGGIDRTTFVGDQGIERIRRRLLLKLRLGSIRPEGRSGPFGRFKSRFEWAKVSQTVRDPVPPEPAAANSQQTIVDVDLHLGVAIGPRVAVQTRARWASVTTGDLPLPLSEQFYIGGATTVRGHREDERHGEMVSHGSLEFVLGAARGGNVYAFYDLGYVRDTVELDGRLRAQEAWIRGLGMGIRTPAPFGRIDLSLGFPGTVGFSEGLIHLALINEF